MSGLDIFAWIVLIILVASIVAVFCIVRWLPGHIAKTRGHPQGGKRSCMSHFSRNRPKQESLATKTGNIGGEQLL
jgi:hypothetical protein